MFNNQISASFVVNGFSKRRLHLLCNVEVVEDGHSAIVFLHDVDFVGSYQSDVVPDLLVNVIVVDVYAVIGRVEKVSQQCHSPACFLKYDLWSGCCFLYLFNGILPSL